jgi:putative heme transporter
MVGTAETGKPGPSARLVARAKRVGWISGSLLLAAACVVGLVLLLAKLYLVTMPVVIALLLSTALRPPARWLIRRRLPRSLAALVVVLVALAILGGLIFAFGPRIVSQAKEAVSSAREGAGRVIDWGARVLPLSREHLDQLLSRGAEQMEGEAAAIGAGVVSGARTAVEIVIGLVIAWVLVFFFVRDGDRMFTWIVERVPGRWREGLSAAGQRAWQTLGGYLRGSAVVALVDAAGIGIGLLVIGVPLVVPLMLLTFIGGFFPIVGAFSAGLIAVLVALVSGGLTDALLTLAVVVGVQQLETNVLEPVILGRAVPLHPVVIILAITAGTVLAGIAGAFLAVPVTAVLVAVTGELRARIGRPANAPA